MVAGDDGGLLVRLAVHDRGEGGGEVATLVAVVGQAAAHQQRAEVGVAESERPELVAVLLDLRRRVGRVVDEDLLRGQGQRGRVAIGLGIELTVRVDELHEVQDARLQAVSLRNMYSEHGLDA